MLTLNERFVTDAEGRRIAVQLDIDDYYRLLESLRLAELLRAPKATELSEVERDAVRREGLDALRALQTDASQRGLDRMSDDDITAEIRASCAARRTAK